MGFKCLVQGHRPCRQRKVLARLTSLPFSQGIKPTAIWAWSISLTARVPSNPSKPKAFAFFHSGWANILPASLELGAVCAVETKGLAPMFETEISQISHYFTIGNMLEVCLNTKISLQKTHPHTHLINIKQSFIRHYFQK